VSNELQRRLIALEKKITGGVPISCGHPMRVLFNPTEQELKDARETLAACPRCSMPSVGPKIVIVEFDPS